MRVLVGCEESQEVCKAFRALGHEAYSCDILPCSGGHPDWHIQGDVLEHLNDGWDIGIFHPPCTFLSNSGVRWLWEKEGVINKKRWNQLLKGAAFFKTLLNSNIPFLAVENPIPHKYAIELIGRKYDQCIQPYQFGHTESKATCFWLKGLPKLEPTNDVKDLWKTLPKKESQKVFYCSPGIHRAKIRSKTFSGVAKAMAEQWTNI